ncbi:MAG: Crp/Fnr family transcriptional regulator [Bacteroidales bacterium]
MSSIYEIMMNLPLFKGVSREKISELIEKNRFHFLKYASDEQIVATGDVCNHIRFIISGDARIELSNFNHKLMLSEVISAPNVIGADYLFGMNTRYPFDVYASGGSCGILQIEKADYINILYSDKVFLFNILNSLSRNCQKYTEGLLSLSSGSVAERLSFLILSLTQRGGKDICMKFKQKDLCTLLSVQRNSLVNALNDLNSRGIIEFTTSEIKVNSRELLQEFRNSSDY